jgi:apolipoprotein N-acyltransferase
MQPLPHASSPVTGGAEPSESPLSRSPWLLSTNNLRLAFLLAAVWVAQEWFRSVVFSGWGWNTLGTALHGQLAMIQITQFTGVAGLSFLVAFTNVILLTTARRFLLEMQVRPMRPHYDLTLTMAAIVGVMGFGIRSLQQERPAKTLNVALVQPNVPREQKFSAEFAQATFDKFTRLSAPALGASDRLAGEFNAGSRPARRAKLPFRHGLFRVGQDRPAPGHDRSG